MSMSIATGRLLLVSRAAALRGTICALPRASLALRNGVVCNARSFSLYSLMRASSATATAKKTPAKSKSKSKTAAAKKKPEAKKKKPAAKPKAKKAVKKKAIKKKAVKKVPKKTARKPLTEEQKQKRELLKLKKMALLKGPAKLPATAWTLYVAQNVRKGEKIPVTEQIPSMASSFRNLSDDERQDLQRIADSNKAKNERKYEEWILSFPPEVIYGANLARRRICKILNKSRANVLHDERQPSRALTAYSRFIKDNYVTHEGVPASENFRQMGERWRSLSDGEKAPYLQAATSEAKTSSARRKELKQKAAAYWKDQDSH